MPDQQTCSSCASWREWRRRDRSNEGRGIGECGRLARLRAAHLEHLGPAGTVTRSGETCAAWKQGHRADLPRCPCGSGLPEWEGGCPACYPCGIGLGLGDVPPREG
jgi:hypothetical protein